MRRLLIFSMIAVALLGICGLSDAQTNRPKATDFYGDVSVTTGFKLTMPSDVFVWYGTGGLFRQRYSVANSRLELTDAAGNVMGYWADNGTAGSFTTTASLTAAGTVTGAKSVFYGGNDWSAKFGCDYNAASTLTDSTNKVGRIGVPHFLNAQLPVIIFTTSMQTATNNLYFGGGTSVGNAATNIQFFTAADNITATGTARVTIDNTGIVTFSNRINTAGGVHVGGTSDPGTDNIIVDGTSTLIGAVNKVTITPPATSATLALADGSTLATAGAYSTTLTSTADTNITLPSGTGYVQGMAVSAAPATTGTMTIAHGTTRAQKAWTITPTGACTFNATGGVAGQDVRFIITTSGISSYVLTFGTNFVSQGTLATGTTTAKKFVVSFIYDGTNWVEMGRTAAM